ncbi:MAG: SpoIIE family protein phosphatase [Chloroflexi bacterium]|nr:SpoIIE family protein phosphatase [Chloroflexota bacterium]MBU1749395.1 SpoIIE family protein phosphatase [Chloroflexota bacterium]
MNSEYVRLLQQAFGNINPDTAAQLAQVARERTYDPGDVLLRQGDQGHDFYVLASGQVAVTRHLASPDEQTLAQRGPGDIIGEMALLDDAPRLASIHALTPVRVLAFDEAAFQALLAHSLPAALQVIRLITARLREADYQVIADLERKYAELQAAQAAIIEKKRMERDLEIAAEVQQSLLPKTFPQVPELCFAARNIPARQVGGDFYDVMLLSPDHVGMAAADVSDKGIHAAIFMAVTRSLLRAVAGLDPNPSQTLQRVHDLLLEVSTSDMFVTVFYGVFHRPTHRFRYARAGHDQPLWHSTQDGSTHLLKGRGRFLGMLSPLELEDYEVQLAPGDVIVSYSDGITDAHNPAGERFGLPRVQALLEAHLQDEADSLCDTILDAVGEFQAGSAQFDDQTLLVMRVNDK